MAMYTVPPHGTQQSDTAWAGCKDGTKNPKIQRKIKVEFTSALCS